MIDRFYIRSGVSGWPVEKQEALCPAGIEPYRDILSSAKLKLLRENPDLLIQRNAMLRPTSRSGKEVIGVASLRILACSCKDFLAVTAAAFARGASIYAFDTGETYSPDMTAAQTNEMNRRFVGALDKSRTAYSQPKGVIAAAERKAERREAALVIARKHWGDPASELSALEVAKLAGLKSAQVLYKHLGPRWRAKERQIRRNAKKEKGNV